MRDGLDPTVHRKQRAATTAANAEATFEAVALRWHARGALVWKPRYAVQVTQRFENDVFPAIDTMPIRAITPALVLLVIRRIEAREAHEMAHRVRQHLSEVFVFAIASGWAEDLAHKEALIDAAERCGNSSGRNPRAELRRRRRHKRDELVAELAASMTRSAAEVPIGLPATLRIQIAEYDQWIATADGYLRRIDIDVFRACSAF